MDRSNLLAISGFLANPRCRIELKNYATRESVAHIRTRTFYGPLRRHSDDTLSSGEILEGQTSLLFWDIDSQLETKRFSSHGGRIYDHCFFDSPALPECENPNCLATCAGDNGIKVWNVARAEERAHLMEHQNIVSSICHDSDRGFLYSGSHGGVVKQWDVEREEKVFDFPLPGVSKINQVALNQKRGLLCVGGNGCVRLFSLKDGAEIHEYSHPGSEVTSLCWSPRSGSDSTLVCGDRFGRVHLPDVRRLVRSCERKVKVHSSEIWTLCPLPGGLWASGSNDSTVGLWYERDEEAGKVAIGAIPMDGPVFGVCFLGVDESELPHGADDVATNFELLESFDCTSYTIQFGDGREIETSKCLLLPSAVFDSSNTSCAVSIHSETLTSEVVLSALLGLPVEIQHLYPLFRLFEKLNLRRRAYLMCKQLSQIEDLESLVELSRRVAESHDSFLSSYGSFLKYLSPFGTALLDQLRGQYEILKESIELMSRLPVLVEKALGSSGGSKGLTDHVYFSGIKDELPTSEEHLMNLNGQLLFNCRHLGNVRVRTEDGQEEMAHLEVLICRSSVFSHMLRFMGSEFDEVRSSRTILVTDCLHVELLELLHWIYCRSITEFGQGSLRTLVRLLVFGTMYNEESLVQDSQRAITHCLESISLGRFCASLFDIADLLSLIPGDLKSWFCALSASYWKNETSVDDMLSAFGRIEMFRVVKEREDEGE